MEQEFKLSLFSKIFYGLAVAALVVFPLYLLTKHPDTNNIGGAIFMIVIMFTGAILLALYIIRRRIAISDAEITVTGMFNTRRLATENIKGYRIKDKAIFVYSTDAGYRRIMINDYDAVTSDLTKVLASKYVDLDAIDYKEELTVVLGNNDHGYTEAERIEELKKAQRITLFYNLIPIAFLPVLFIFIKSILINPLTTFFAMLYPIAGILIIFFSQGLIKLITPRTSAYSHIYVGLLLSCGILAGSSAAAYHIVQYKAFSLPFSITFLVFFISVYNKGLLKINGVKGQTIALIFTAIIYSYGFTLFINCKLDRSEPTVYQSTVLSTYITHGKSTVCYIVISGTNTNDRSRDIIVSDDLYNRIYTGQILPVYTRKGLFHIPWYYINSK